MTMINKSFIAPMANVTRRDVYHMSATIYGEARGETLLGKVAVGWVIRNRVLDPRWWGNSIITVCRKPKQFSCWNSDDPNYTVVMNRSRYYHDEDYIRDPVFRECFLAALMVIHGTHEDITQGANHYHRTGSPAWWRDASKLTGSVCNHTFYKF